MRAPDPNPRLEDEPLHRLHRRMRFVSAALATLLGFTGLPAAEPRAKSHLAFRQETLAAYQRKDYAAARAALLAALELRPDSPRYLHHLAAVSALAGDEKSALEYLRKLAALGVATAVERDADFARLQGKPEFNRVLQQLAANREPRGAAEVFAELPGRTGIIEGLAWRPRTDELFLSDVHHRCIWRRDRDGRITRYTEEGDEELLGIFGLALDEERNSLWAAMAALPEMSGFTAELKGRAALAEINLATSAVRRVIPVPGDGRDHGLGDVLVAPDGTVYATDSLAPIIWQLVPGEAELVKLVESPDFVSLQGLVLAGRTLIVADYANGLFAIDVKEGSVRALHPPPNATLLGLDGLLAVAGGILAVQNGVTPQRALRIGLSADRQTITEVKVLAAALPHFHDLTLVSAVAGRPAVIAGAGWDAAEAAKGKTPAAHTVRIFHLDLP